MKILIQKDIRHLKAAFPSAVLLGVPLILILQFTTEGTEQGILNPLSAFWIAYFFSSVALLYRSFSLEHRNSSFIVYTAFGIAKWKVFWSHCLAQWMGLVLLGVAYGLLFHLFWPQVTISVTQSLGVLALTSLALAPIGSFLGLLLQTEREFLFSIFFLPLCTPVLLAAHQLTIEWTDAWFSVLSIFCLIGSFLSSLLFEFYFDELSQTH